MLSVKCETTMYSFHINEQKQQDVPQKHKRGEVESLDKVNTRVAAPRVVSKRIVVRC